MVQTKCGTRQDNTLRERSPVVFLLASLIQRSSDHFLSSAATTDVSQQKATFSAHLAHDGVACKETQTVAGASGSEIEMMLRLVFFLRAEEFSPEDFQNVLWTFVCVFNASMPECQN